MSKNVSIRHNAVSNFYTFLIEINVFRRATADLSQFLTTICLKYKNKLLTVRTLNDYIYIYSIEFIIKTKSFK